MARASAVKMPPEANAAHGCEGARRVLALMLTFSADDHTLTARQLAERTGIALPSVYRYLTLLRETGLLAGDERGSYRLSARLVGLAKAAEAAESIIDVANPVMRDLAGRTGETVILVRLIGRSAVCVHRVQSAQQLRISFEAGQPLPLDGGPARGCCWPASRRTSAGSTWPRWPNGTRRPRPCSRRRSSSPASRASRPASRRSTGASGPPRPRSCRASAWSRCSPCPPPWSGRRPSSGPGCWARSGPRPALSRTACARSAGND